MRSRIVTRLLCAMLMLLWATGPLHALAAVEAKQIPLWKLPPPVAGETRLVPPEYLWPSQPVPMLIGPDVPTIGPADETRGQDVPVHPVPPKSEGALLGQGWSVDSLVDRHGRVMRRWDETQRAHAALVARIHLPGVVVRPMRLCTGGA